MPAARQTGGQGSFAMDDYIDVAERIRQFHEQFPEGTLQQANLQFLEFAGGMWVVYTAAAYRDREDQRPGVGTAWEPVPGRTSFTRDSEVQNAETAAWGRAIVALGITGTKRISSAEEVRNRRADAAERQSDPDFEAKNEVKATIKNLMPGSGTGAILAYVKEQTGKPDPDTWTLADLIGVRDTLVALNAPTDTP